MTLFVRRVSLFLTFGLVINALPSCTRQSTAPNDAGADASPPIVSAIVTAAPPPQQDRLPDPEDASVPASEPVRKLVQNIDDEPALAKQRDAILGFFKDDLPSPIATQFEALPGDRTAILIPGKTDHSHPFVMVIDANGTRAWTKEMPLAGIVPGVHDIAIVRGPESSVGVAFCDSTGHRAALRTWLYDGTINADFEVMEVPHCDKISAVYIPNVGHIVASVGEATARIGMIAVNGMRAWDPAGIELPWAGMPRTALTIAVDTADSFIVIGTGMVEGKTQPIEGAILAMRYDFQGREMWKIPMTLGQRSKRTLDRMRVRVIESKKLEVDLEEKPLQRVALSSDGVVVPLK